MMNVGDAPSLGEQISARLEALATHTSEPGKLTRLYLTSAHRAAVDQVTQWMTDAGMATRLDATATLIGRYEAATPDASTLLLGSHIDTVRDAGRFDGALGVLAAIAVVSRLHAAGTRLPFAIEVVAFGDEEGVRFPSTLSGSRALAGRFDPKSLDERDSDGVTRREALIAFGCDPDAIQQAAYDPPRVLGYVELHIEQGPVLEAEALALAVVAAINGASRGEVVVSGTSAHAGTVPMALRRDALTAAAAMMLAVEQRAAAEADLVGTVGRLQIENAATNTIPGQVRFTIDIRSPSDAARKVAADDIARGVVEIAKARGVTAGVAWTYDAPAAVADAGLMRVLAASMADLGLAARSMTSGAGHDAMAFGGRIPFAMLFVRCRGGISHNPAEFASAADIDVTVRVLERFVLTFQA